MELTLSAHGTADLKPSLRTPLATQDYPAGQARTQETGRRGPAVSLPAVRAAERSARALQRLIEDLEEPIAIFDRLGLLQHAGTTFITTIESDPRGQEVWEAARCLASDVAAVRPINRRVAAELRRQVGQRSLRTTSFHYRLRAALVESWEPRPLVLVSLQVLGNQAPSSSLLRQRFGLTGREAEVALLLAAGRSNREIASQLGCSGHTARRHTERVLAKFSVPCRAQVAALLARV